MAHTALQRGLLTYFQRWTVGLNGFKTGDGVEIEGEQFRLIMLGYLVDRAITSECTSLDLGLRSDQISVLSHLPSSDLARLAQLRDPKIRLHFDLTGLNSGIKKLSEL